MTWDGPIELQLTLTTHTEGYQATSTSHTGLNVRVLSFGFLHEAVRDTTSELNRVSLCYSLRSGTGVSGCIVRTHREAVSCFVECQHIINHVMLELLLRVITGSSQNWAYEVIYFH
jgi:hypothetical protein